MVSLIPQYADIDLSTVAVESTNGHVHIDSVKPVGKSVEVASFV